MTFRSTVLALSGFRSKWLEIGSWSDRFNVCGIKEKIYTSLIGDMSIYL